jgi:hypothetical protein
VNIYPQIGAGAVAQLPLQRTRAWRSITNQLESGERILMPDDAAAEIQWSLRYTDLGDSETKALTDLFTGCSGRYGSFLFVDPLANLLGWSEDLSRPDWQLGSVSQSNGIADPWGTQRASSVSNGASGSQTLSQTLSIPGAYMACFSAWVRSDAPGSIVLQRDDSAVTAVLSPVWRRIYVAARSSALTQSTFSIVLAAGQTIDVFGLQIEAQPYPSIYKGTQTARGIYEETRFDQDELEIVNTAPGLSSCNLNLVSRI